MKKNISKKKANEYRKTASIASASFFLTFTGLVSFYLAFADRPEISETENRRLAEFPTFSFENYISGEFAAAVDNFFTDTVPFRDTLNGIASKLEKAKGMATPQFYGAVAVVNDDDDFGEEYDEPYAADIPQQEEAVTAPPTDDEAAPDVTTVPPLNDVTTVVPAETSQPAEESRSGNIDEFLNNGILVDGVNMYGEKAGIMLFGGNKKQGARYAQLISSYKRALGENVNVYNLVVPTSVEFYLPEKYKKYSGSEKDAIDNIYANLTDGVISVDAYSVLEAHKDEYIYFRTDHHWTDLGAYYAYTAFCNTIGQTPPTLDSYITKTKDEPYVGSLYGYTNDITLKNNPDTFTYHMTKSPFTGESFRYDTLRSLGSNPIYHEYAAGSAMYGLYLGGDSLHIKITTNAGTGRKIVMFKESYGNAFAPYLIDSFDEIYVIDIRYFGRNAVDYIKEVGATDVLFIDNAFAANTSSLISGIERMLTSPTGTIIITEPPVTETSETAKASSTTEKPAKTEKSETKPQETTVPTTSIS